MSAGFDDELCVDDVPVAKVLRGGTAWSPPMDYDLWKKLIDLTPSPSRPTDADLLWEISLPTVERRKDFAEYAIVAIGAALLAERAGDTELMCSCAREAAAHIKAHVRNDAVEDPEWLKPMSDLQLLRHAGMKILGGDVTSDRLPYAVLLLRVLCQRYDGKV